jgi:hypothetical protein
VAASLSADAARAEIDRFLLNYDQEVARREVGQRGPESEGQEPTGEAPEPGSLEDAGILSSFRNRRDALEHFNTKLRNAQKVVIVGSSLKGLIHPGGAHPDTRAILRERVARQREDSEGLVTTDFVLTHPAFADLRAEQENRAKQDIGREVIKSLMYLMEWEAQASSVHLYLGTPTCFGILADDQMILNPYPYADVAFLSPCLLLEDSGYFFLAFAKSHFGVLDRTMVVRLSDLPNDIGDLYVSLERFRERTDELLGTARQSTSRPRSLSETESDLENMPGFLDIATKARKRHGLELPEENSAAEKSLENSGEK